MATELIGPDEKKEISKLLARAKSREIAYLETTLHAAYVAALQIFAKRIEFLEARKDKPKQPDSSLSFGDFVFDVFLDLVISGVGGKIIEQGLENLIRPLIRSRQAYYAIPKIKIEKKKIKIKGVHLNEKQLKAARKKAKEKLKDHFNRIANSEDFTAFDTIAKAVMDSTLNIGSDAAREELNLPSSVQKLKAQKSTKGMTPTVEILTATLAGYNLQKSAVEILYADLKTELDYADIPKAIGALWKGFLEVNLAASFSTKADLASFEQMMVRWYEMTMWAYLFDVDGLSRSRKDTEYVRGPEITSDQNVARQKRVADPRNYEIYDSDETQVSYRVPVLGAGRMGYGEDALVRNMRRFVTISERVMNYWIHNFPYRMDDLNGSTIFEHFDKVYGFSKGEKNRDDRTLIRSYEHALSSLATIRRELVEGKRKLDLR